MRECLVGITKKKALRRGGFLYNTNKGNEMSKHGKKEKRARMGWDRVASLHSLQ